jgi:hypothetical protein
MVRSIPISNSLRILGAGWKMGRIGERASGLVAIGLFAMGLLVLFRA